MESGAKACFFMCWLTTVFAIIVCFSRQRREIQSSLTLRRDIAAPA
jgi:hypothetical protein